MIAAADWSRFKSYARRVKDLTFEDKASREGKFLSFTLNVQAMAMISLFHPDGPSIIPALTKLCWITRSPLAPMIPFLSGELTDLKLDIGTYDAPEATGDIIVQAFDILRERVPRLKLLHLNVVQGPEERAVIALAQWLGRMKSLETIELSSHLATVGVMHALGTLPKLQRIHHIDFGCVYNEVPVLAGRLPRSAFPSLVELTFIATPRMTQQLLSSPSVLSTLSRLTLIIPTAIGMANVSNLARKVARHCTKVTDITLRSQCSSKDDGKPAPLPMEVVKCLFPCKYLRSLRVFHVFPLEFNSVHIAEMASAWPGLTTLILSPEPDFRFYTNDISGYSIIILSSFAQHFPELRELGLYLHGRDQVHFDPRFHPKYRFTELKSLQVGLSPSHRAKKQDLAFYIAGLCLQDVEVSFGRSVRFPGTLPADYHSRKSAWMELNSTVAFASRIKAGVKASRGSEIK